MTAKTSTNDLFELTCAAGSWLEGVKEGETFCVFSRKGTHKSCLKSDKFYCILPRTLYQKFFWAQYPKSYKIEGEKMFGILTKADAFTTKDFLQKYESKNLLD